MIMFGNTAKRIDFCRGDIRRLDMSYRHVTYRVDGKIEKIWNLLDCIVYCDETSGSYIHEYFFDPSSIDYEIVAKKVAEVGFKNDIMCYYMGNPDRIFIFKSGWLLVEYFSGKDIWKYIYTSHRNQLFSEKIIDNLRKNALIPLEEINELIEDLPASHYWVSGNPGFDLRICYEYMF